MTILRNDWVSLLFRLFLGVIFIYAALDKIAHPQAFAKIINNYHLFPGSLINLFALFLPWLELLVGAALILGTKFEGASFITVGMLVMFVVAVAISIARGVNIDCGCFSTSSHTRQIGLTLLLQDIGMLVAAIYVWVNGAGHWALDRRGTRAS